jgi:sugar phosphate isomerase/epimerase
MRSVSRRQFLQRSGLGVAAATGYLTVNSPWQALRANALGLPIGLQLYTVRELLSKDYEGTIRDIGKIGYQEVELFGEQTRPAAELKQLLQSAGLRAPSAHYSVKDLKGDVAAKIAYAKELGLSYMVCAFPAIADPSRITPMPGDNEFKVILRDINLDDFKAMADLFNKVGEQTRKAGIQLGYHNHNLEFRSFGGVVAYDELLRRTDPALVKMEMDIGWVTIAGQDPIALLKKYPGRFPLLHVKDVKPGVKPALTIEGDAPTTPVGAGSIDWTKLFAAARTAGVTHYFVEQETFDGPPLDALKASYDYLHAMKA